MPVSAAIYGCSGHSLTDGERAFFSDASPWGFILFARNIEKPAQVRRLTDELRELAGRDDLPILLDQDGGRVGTGVEDFAQRLRGGLRARLHRGVQVRA